MQKLHTQRVLVACNVLIPFSHFVERTQISHLFVPTGEHSRPNT